MYLHIIVQFPTIKWYFIINIGEVKFPLEEKNEENIFSSLKDEY